MTWKDYQTTATRRVPTRASLFLGVAALFGICSGYLVYVAPWGATTPTESAKKVSSTLSKSDLASVLTEDMLIAGRREVRVAEGDRNWSVELALDPDLQKEIERRLVRHKVDWGAVAVLDVGTGEVLALASHSEKNPNIGNLALKATFPAASIFKIVTAAAAVGDGNFNRNSEIRFSGGIYSVRKREMLRSGGRDEMTLAEALGKSANVVFGKLAMQGVRGPLLEQYATRFGFNNDIPFEFRAEPSAASIPALDPLEEARTAAGFGNVTLSPLHGAMIAAAALNDGVMMEPSLVRKVTGADGRILYSGESKPWLTAMTPEVAKEVRAMMRETVTHGTGRRAFRRVDRDRVLGALDIGGKTGSLTGTNPKGRTEWFVGFARGAHSEVAIAAVVVNDKVWRVKPSELVRDILRFYFDERVVQGSTL